MTFILIALWIVGNTFKWYWLAGAVVLDLVLLSIRLNFITALVRRAIEESAKFYEQPPGPPPGS